MKTSLSDMYLIIVLPVAMVSMVVTHLRENWILKKSIKISEVAQLCLTLCNPLDCSPPGSSIHGILPGKSTIVGCHILFHFHSYSYKNFQTRGTFVLLVIYRNTMTCPTWTAVRTKDSSTKDCATTNYALPSLCL